jgi:hypothetical protein
MRKDTVTCRTDLIVRQQGEHLEEQLVRALKHVQGLAGKGNKPSNGLGLATKQLDIIPLLAAGGAAGDTAGQYSQASSNWSTRWRMWGRAAVKTTKKASSAGVVPPPHPDPDGAMDYQSSRASFTTSWWSRSCSTSSSASRAAKTRADRKAGSPSSPPPPPPLRSPSTVPLDPPSGLPPLSPRSGLEGLCKHGPQQDVPCGVEPANVVVPKVERDTVGKRGGEGGVGYLEPASRAAAGAGVAALDVEFEYGGVSAGLCGGDTAGGRASETPRAATANAVTSAALHRVDFPDAFGPMTARMERTSAPRSVFSANQSGASLKSPDSSTTCATPSLDMAAARVGIGKGRTRRRVGATDEALAGAAGYLWGGRLELVCVPPLITALALRPRAPRQRRSIETRPRNTPRLRVGVRLWWRQNSNAGEAAVVPRRRHRNRDPDRGDKRCRPPPSDARATAKCAPRISRRRRGCLAWLVAHAARCRPSPRRRR